MSLRTLALDWSLDGPVGTAFLTLVVAAGALLSRGGRARSSARSAPPAMAVEAQRVLPRWPRRAGGRLVLGDRDRRRRAAVGPHGRAHGDVGRGGAAARGRCAGPAGILRATARRASPARAVAALAPSIDAHAPRRNRAPVLRRPLAQPRSRHLWAHAAQRLRARDRARALPAHRDPDVGVDARSRSVATSSECPRRACVHGRLHAADGTDRAVARSRAPSPVYGHYLGTLGPSALTTSGSRRRSCGSGACRRSPCPRWRACASRPAAAHSRRSQPAAASANLTDSRSHMRVEERCAERTL